jgi:exodeoxyribonuclease V gamma subunit
MLHIHFSNRHEVLTRKLLSHLGDSTGGVFDAEQVIVPSAAVRRSLTLAIAREHGICANVEWGFLAHWLWRQIGRFMPTVAEQSPFAAPLLTWRIHAALNDREFIAVQPRLAAYVGEADEVMRYELATRVAQLFEQYITYRPDWLDAWGKQRPADLGADRSARADEQWQAALWRRIEREVGVSALHPGEAFLKALGSRQPDLFTRAVLPRSAHLVALAAMPPLYLPWLQQLGQHMEVHLYVLNPCREYWFEIIDRKRLAHLRARAASQGHEVGNRLLAAWGRQTQSHVDLLVDAAGDAAQDDADFQPSDHGTLLGRFQNAILDLVELEPGAVAMAADDRSIEVHVCHSLTREIEALHDHLLGLFAADPNLQPSDILVVTPDIEAAAPLIEAVFGTATRERRIPYAITGRARSTMNLPAQALLALLSLATSRLAATELFGLLQQPVVAARFGLDADALQQVHDWMLQAGIRWGLDAAHREACGVPPTAHHTLSEGLDRLFLGYALPSTAGEPFEAWLPAGDAEGSDAVALGAFAQFAQALAELRARLAVPQLPDDWCRLLLDALAGFVAAGADELDDLRELQADVRALTETMQRGGATQPIPVAVMRAALTQWLDDPARGGVPTGSVTFSSMSSLRGLPYAVVCMIGLDDRSFPTSARAPEFDLMSLRPRRGDRQRRHDERNLFLDLLLAARRSVYLGYTGRSIRDNAPLPPSVLVAELLDVLVPAIADDPASPESLAAARRRLVVEHPLQAFSLDAYSSTGDARLRSFDREMWQALRNSLQAPPPSPAMVADDAGEADADPDDADDAAPIEEPAQPFFVAALPEPGAEWREVRLEQLVEFFGNPCRYLLRRRLGIELQHDDEELQDDEPFLVDRPARWALADRLLPALLDGMALDDARALAQAGTEMPAGAIGELELARELHQMKAFADRVRTATGDACLPPHQAVLQMDLDGQAWSVHAGFADLRACGLVRHRYDERRPGHLLRAWLHHLVLCAAPATAAAACTDWHLVDGVLRLKAPSDPAALLGGLLAIYRRGLREPVHFFPKSAWAYVEGGDDLNRARKKWRPSKEEPWAEGGDAAYRLALRGQADPLDDEFAALAKAVFHPLMRHMEWEG